MGAALYAKRLERDCFFLPSAGLASGSGIARQVLLRVLFAPIRRIKTTAAIGPRDERSCTTRASAEYAPTALSSISTMSPIDETTSSLCRCEFEWGLTRLN